MSLKLKAREELKAASCKLKARNKRKEARKELRDRSRKRKCKDKAKERKNKETVFSIFPSKMLLQKVALVIKFCNTLVITL